MALSPSAQIVHDALRESDITDSRGRVIRVRRLTALDKFNLFEAIGQDNDGQLVKNQAALGYATLAACVVSIDGAELLFPKTTPQVRAAIGRLGDEGLSAVARYLNGGDIASTSPDGGEGEADSL